MLIYNQVQEVEQEMKGAIDMAYNYRKLLGKIIEVFSTQANFAREIGLSERSLSLKLNGKVDWKQTEIVNAINLLGIDKSEIDLYFFTI